jgi:hypothetical protein
LTWCLRHPRWSTSRRRVLQELAEADVDVWCLGGEAEIKQALTVLGAPAADQRQPQVTIRRGLDHGLLPEADRTWVIDQLTARIARRHGTMPMRARPARR